MLPLNAEESSSEESNVDSEEELPEYSEPPFTIGDRAIIQGYYIPLEEGISLNFRIRSNQMFVYWVDEDDLIIEPQASVGSFRVISTARDWHQSATTKRFVFGTHGPDRNRCPFERTTPRSMAWHSAMTEHVTHR